MASVIVSGAIFGGISPSSSSSAGRYVDDEEGGGDCREVRNLGNLGSCCAVGEREVPCAVV